MRNLEIWFWRKELSLKTKIKIVTLFSPESSSNRTNPSLQASGQKVKTIAKMSPDKIRSKRTNVQCDDRRPDQTTIYDQESIKYRPPPPFPSFWTRPKVQWAAYSSDHCQTHDFRFARPFKINHRKFKAKPKVQTAKCVKPLQNKKGQKNLGYPRKKQSFSL